MSMPLESSYWVVPGSFMAGAYPHQQENVAALLKEGITCFVNLTEEGELPAYHHTSLFDGVVHHRLSVKDYSVPSPDRMKEILDAIDTTIADGGKVYVHCYGGVGRTGTVVGCYLKRHGCTEPLKELKELFETSPRCQHGVKRESPETDQQRAFVEQWKE